MVRRYQLSVEIMDREAFRKIIFYQKITRQNSTYLLMHTYISAKSTVRSWDISKTVKLGMLAHIILTHDLVGEDGQHLALVRVSQVEVSWVRIKQMPF